MNAQVSSATLTLTDDPATNLINTLSNQSYYARDQITVVPNGTGGEVHLKATNGGPVYLIIEPSNLVNSNYSFNSSSASGSNETESSTQPVTDITRTLDLNLPVGSTSSSYVVSQNGTLNYNIPILIPPGTNNLTPKLSINYNSSRGNGIVGYGWDIGGIDAISRSAQTIYHNNGVAQGVTMTNADWFAYNGNKLIVTSSGKTNGEDQCVYGNEDESFNITTSYGTQGNGPQYFIMKTKEGLTYEFGATYDSQVIPYGQNTVYTWLIDKISDNYGNYISFKYSNNQGFSATYSEVYIYEIDYTGNSNLSTEPYNKIIFNYASREDVNSLYVGGGKMEKNVILDRIKIESEGNVIMKEYNFNYSFNNVFSFLTKVTETGADGSNYNPLLFSYQDDNNSGTPNVVSQTVTDPANTGPYYKYSTPFDANEDGLEDLLTFYYSPPGYSASQNYWVGWNILINKGNNQFKGLFSSLQAFPDPNNVNIAFYPADKTQPGSTLFNMTDIDGDGKEDILFVNPAQSSHYGGQEISISVGLAKNNFQLVNVGSVLADQLNSSNYFGSLKFLDFNGDQKLDLIYANSDVFTYYCTDPSNHQYSTQLSVIFDISTPTSFALGGPSITTYGAPGQLANGALYDISQAYAADVNGDGKSELVNVFGYGSQVVPCAPQIGPYYPSTTQSTPYILSYTRNPNVTSACGAPPFCALVTDANGYVYQDITELSLTQDISGVNLSTNNISSINSCPNSYMTFSGDFNGDLKTDYMNYVQNTEAQGPGGSWTISYGKGDGTVEVTSINNVFTDPFLNYSNSYNPPCSIYQSVQDINNDGKSDFVEINYIYGTNNSGTGNLNVYYSTGTSFIKEVYSLGLIVDPTTISFADFNGDGSLDLFMNEGTIIYFYEGVNSKYLKQAVDGYNTKTQFEFSSIANSSTVYSQSNQVQNYPYNNYNGSLYVVSKIISPDGAGGDAVQTFSYQDAIIYKQGLGFLGFNKFTANNSAMQSQVVQTYNILTTSSPVIIDRALSTSSTYTVQGASSTLIDQTTYSPTIFSLNPNTLQHFVGTINKVENNSLTGATSITSYTYDNNITNPTNNNITNIYTNVNGGLETYSTTNTYVTIPTFSGIPCRLGLTNKSITRNSQTYVRETKYTYTNEGNVLTMVEDPIADIPNSGSTQKEVDTKFTYNSVGLATAKVVNSPSDNSVPTKTYAYTYDNYYRNITSCVNPIGQTTQMTYDPMWGKQLTITGIDNLTTNFTYDAFGKNISTLTPDGLTSTLSYDWVTTGETSNWTNDPFSVTNNALYKVTSSKQGKPNTTNYYDLYDRIVKTIADGFSGPISALISYDAFGNIYQQTNSYDGSGSSSFSPVLSTYNYDNLHRIVSTSQTDGNITNSVNYGYAYSAGTSTTTITTNGKTFKKIYDASNLLTTSIDDAATLTYAYSPNHQPTSINLGSNTTSSIIYDAYGRMMSQTDPNSGTTTYEFNAYGLLHSTHDNAGATAHNYTYTYDQLDRPTQVVGAGETYSYNYVNAGNGINQLQQLSGPTFNYNYSYDNLNRPIEVLENIGAGGSFSTTYSYDQYNNISKITYPGSGFAINKIYDTHGYLTKINKVDDNSRIWQTNTLNPLGQCANYYLGNNSITVNKTYTNFGYAQNFSANLGGTSIQNYSFNFDPLLGNLKSRTDYRASGNTLTESFSYDLLDRLLTASNPNNGSLNLSLNYDQTGNITNNSNIGGYSYSSSKINELIQVPTNNIISSSTQNVYYTAFNKPNLITNLLSDGTGTQVALTYGPDHQRREADFSNSIGGSISSSIFYQDNYEKIVSGTTTTEINYINGLDGLCAMYVNQNGVGSMYYVFTDHLGSILKVTDASGNIAAEQSFDVFGNYRNPDDWSYTNIPTNPTWLLRGFTGHEHLPQFSLINMNARLYDPQTGKMLSPDNFVSNTGSSQAFNRYSYANNNPLRFTDPTGNWDGWDDLAAILIGGTANLVSNWSTVEAQKKGHGKRLLTALEYFGIGAGAAEVALYAGPVEGFIIGGAGNVEVDAGNHKFDHLKGGDLGQAIGQSFLRGGLSALTGAEAAVNVGIEGQVDEEAAKGLSDLITGENTLYKSIYQSAKAVFNGFANNQYNFGNNGSKDIYYQDNSSNNVGSIIGLAAGAFLGEYTSDVAFQGTGDPYGHTNPLSGPGRIVNSFLKTAVVNNGIAGFTSSLIYTRGKNFYTNVFPNLFPFGNSDPSSPNGNFWQGGSTDLELGLIFGINHMLRE